MKLLVRLRRLAVAINPERRVINEIAGKPMPSRRKRRTTMSTARKQQEKEKDPTLNARAPKRKARGSRCPQGKGNRRRSKLTITNPDAAGIDVGSQVHYVAVPEDRAEESVRSFGAYTAQLDELVQWLKDCGIKTVAMESTGVYWISGLSGMAILDAILAGERDPRKLASLAHYRVQKSQAQIEAALTGDYRPELLFVLSQSLQNYRQVQQQITQCDLSIEKQLAKMSDCKNPSQAAEPTPPSQDLGGGKPRKRKSPVALEISLAGHLKRILGVDLTTIPGLNVLAILTLLSEIGTNMAKWRNEKAFVSWLGLSPNNKISGQRVLSSRTRKVVNR